MAEKIFEKLVIVGPGLIGGSIGLDSKESGLAGEVIGVGHRRSSLDDALKMGAIDRASLNIEDVAGEGDLIILCTGVGLLPEMAVKAIPLMKPGAILSDVGSTKRVITEKIDEILDRNDISFVGAHPLAGNEKRGIRAARRGLFQGSVCVITPGAHSAPEETERLMSFWRGLGATVCELDPETHDQYLAEVSHLPHLLAAALVDTVSEESLGLAATGFRDVTRIAAGDPHLWVDIFMSNKEAMAGAISGLYEKLADFSSALQKEDRDALLCLLQRAKERRDGMN